MSRLSIEADLAVHKCEHCQKFGHSEDYCPKARAVRIVLAQRFETVDEPQKLTRAPWKALLIAMLGLICGVLLKGWLG